MILVTGATGTTGSEVVKQLSAKGARVRAFVHDLKKAADLGGPGVELVQGDMSQPMDEWAWWMPATSRAWP